MEYKGRDWSERILAGLLAIFVALYFFTDIFGMASADETNGAVPVLGASADGPYAVPVIGASADEISAEVFDLGVSVTPEGVSGYLDPLIITGFTVKVNGRELSESGVNRFNNGDKFELVFAWSIPSRENQSQNVYEYDLTKDLKGIVIDKATEKVDFTKDGNSDMTYSINYNALTKKTTLSLVFGGAKNVNIYSGKFAISGEMKVEDSDLDGDGNFTISFADKTFTLSPNSSYPDLGVSKSAVGPIYKSGDGYYQKFKVVVTNYSAVTSPNVTLTDTHWDLFIDGSFSDVKLNGSPAEFDSGKLYIGDLAKNEKAEIEYTMKVDPAKLATSDGGGNTAKVEDTFTPKTTAEGSAWVSFTRPGIKKSGVFDKANNKITWTVEVNLGVFKDETDIAVVDIPVENVDADVLAAALGVSKNLDGTVTVPLGRLTPLGDGKYTVSYTVPAPGADDLVDKQVRNKARLEIPETPGVTSHEAKVTIPAKGSVEYGVQKDLTGVSADAAGNTVLSWKITAKIPDTELLTSFSVEDSIENANDYYDTDLEIDYTTFKVTGVDGTVNLDTSNIYNYTLPGIGSVQRNYKPHSNFQLQIYNSDFLNRNKCDDGEKAIVITYNMTVKNDTISRVRNIADVVPHISGGDMPKKSDDALYEKPFVVTKAAAYGDTANYGKASRTWSVTLDNKSHDFAAGETIVFTDILPKGYMLGEEASSFVVTTDSREIGVLPSSAYTLTTPVWSDTGENTFTVTVPVTEALAAALNASGGKLSFIYTAHMTLNRYNSFIGAGVEEELVNRASVKVGSLTDNASLKFKVYLKEQILSKSISYQRPVRDDEGNNSFEAYYRLEVNQTLPRAPIGTGANITVTDELGASLTYEEGSLRIYKYNEYNNSWPYDDVTDSTPWTLSGNTFTFTLKNGPYYVIEYKVVGGESDMLFGDELTSTESPYAEQIEKELERRYGNKATLTAAGSEEFVRKAVLDSSTYRKSSSYEHHIRITGAKSWQNAAAGDIPDMITLILTQYKHELGDTDPDGTHVAGTYKYYICREVPDDKKEDPFYRQATVSGSKWTFEIDNLEVSDLEKGIDYYYSLKEDTSDPAFGFTATYSDPDGGDIDDIAKYFIGLDKQSGALSITNSSDDETAGMSKISFRKTGVKSGKNAVPISGAELKLTAVADPGVTDDRDLSEENTLVTVSGGTVTARNTKSITFLTDAGANVTMELPYGKYTLEEVAPPPGFKKDTSVYSFELKDDGTIDAPDSGNYSFKESQRLITLLDKSNTITFRKSDGGGRIGGVRMKLERTDTVTNMKDIVVIPAESSVKYEDRIEFESSASTDTTFRNIPAGTYKMTEMTTPEGFLDLTEKSYIFEVDSDGNITTAGSGSYSVIKPPTDGLTNDLIRLQNDPISFVFEKFSRYGNDYRFIRDKGAKFKLTRADGNTKSLKNVVVKYTPSYSTDIDSVTFITDIVETVIPPVNPGDTETTVTSYTTIQRLPAGEYILTELEPPPGCYPIKPFSFSIDAHQKVTITQQDSGDEIVLGTHVDSVKLIDVYHTLSTT